jgi:vanillate O-demethylase ferredoxin subunit
VTMAPATLDVVVVARRSPTPDVCEIEVHGAAGPLPAYTAGAHIRLNLPSGLKRAYTLCRPPNAEGTYAIAVLKDPRSRGGSHEVHAVCHPGMALRIDVPQNLFPLQAEASEHILVAGGIGITPMRAMAHTLGDNLPWRLHHFVRDRSSAAYADELLQRFGAERVVVHPNQANGPDFAPLQAELRRAAAAPGAHLYVCGPEGMITHVQGLAAQAGWPAGRVHQERFNAPETDAGAAWAFDVVLQSDGRRVRVGAEESIVQALGRVGVYPMVSCEQGVCGTCLTRVLGGVPEHRDAYLSDDERARNDQMLICCSRAQGDELVLDL